ncbi:MAG TPA: S8 family serine peptidase [Sediminibacterium sp.]
MKMFKHHLLFIPIVLLLCTTISSCTKFAEKVDITSLDERSVDNPKYFYYYKGKKRVLTPNTELINIVSKKIIVSENFAKFGTVKTNEEKVEVSKAKTQSTIPSSSSQKQHYYGQLKLAKKASEQEYFAIVNQLKKVDRYTDVYPTFIDPDGIPVGISSLFNVELQSPGDYELLTQVANTYGAIIVRQNEFMPLWYTLSSTESALDMAALFYQTGYFSETEPDISMIYPLSCPTDEFFANQWGANNTAQMGGSAGVDIKLCGALDQTRSTGAVINVAVIDQGVDFSHEDLDMSLYPPIQNHDIVTGGDNMIRGPHGTAVAGIIAARENGKGITGVAPWCRLMSVSVPFVGWATPEISMLAADAINWAVAHGADVINNSWGAIKIPSLDKAIARALAFGRNGKGCVLVFGAGNGGYRTDVEYPANDNPGVLAVGAVTQCGTRKDGAIGCTDNGEGYWFSSYGPQLDVMAPGTLVPTTDISGEPGYTPDKYIQNFWGTSAACPHVSGIAALILSKNPTLYGYEVCNIIESTAQKLGPYVYSNKAGRPNGTWHEQMGYGVVNASAAVAATQRVDVLGILYYGNISNH